MTTDQMMTTHTVVEAQALRLEGSRTLRFEGRDHGSGISFFLVENQPGQGPSAHRHPYTETWTVLEGQATITIADEAVTASAGTTVVVQPDVWHGFTNTGNGVLRIMCVHASAEMVQQWREEPTG